MAFGPVMYTCMPTTGVEYMVRTIETDAAACLFVAVKSARNWAAYARVFNTLFDGFTHDERIENTAKNGGKMMAEHALILFPHAAEIWGEYRP